MLATSQRFQDAVSAGYQHVVAKAEILVSRRVVGTIETGLTGSVTVDSDAKVQRSCAIGLVDPTGDLIPDSFDDWLYPGGNEIKLYRGFRFQDGTEEYVPQGVFRVSKPRFLDRRDRIEISLSGYDRAKTIERARFEAPYVVSGGTNYVTAMKDLITNRMPGLSYAKFMTTTENTPNPFLLFEAQSDPMEAIHKMALAIGAEFLFDVDGDPVLQPVPDPYTLQAVATYERGEYSILEEVDRELDEEIAYSVFVVTGEDTSESPPIRAIAEDTDPNSPTYVVRYGRVPVFMVSGFIRTQAQADAAANALKLRKAGILETVKFNGLVNAAHEANDVVRLRDDKVKVNALHVLDSFTIPLGYAETMTVATRKRRV